MVPETRVSSGAASQPQHLMHTFVLSSSHDRTQPPILHELPTSLHFDPSRRRQAHRKSTLGCENCKQRRIKCNEQFPCGNCKRKGELCKSRRRMPPKTPGSTISRTPSESVSYGGSSTKDDVNLHHMKLFHHFRTQTVATLLATSEIWDIALQLSSEYDFLIHAVLCVAARHLAELKGNDGTLEVNYSNLASVHRRKAVSLFNARLADNFESLQVDAFIATSILFQYEAWADTDDASPSGRLFALSSSMKDVFLKSVPALAHQSSVFLPYLRQNPESSLLQAIRTSPETPDLNYQFFACERQLKMSMLDNLETRTTQVHSSLSGSRKDRVQEKASSHVPHNPYQAAVKTLCLIKSVIGELEPYSHTEPIQSTLSADLARYIFSFPILCRGHFTSLLEEGESHAMLLLYHFYHSVSASRTLTRFWWARRRALASQAALRDWFTLML